MLVDTHCHLNFKAFKGNIREVINRAKKAGVEKIIIPGTDVETSKKAIILAEKYKGVYAGVGIHPHHVLEVKDGYEGELERLAKSKKVVAIGECGLDYHQYKKTKYQEYEITQNFKQKQKQVFTTQIELAGKLGLPLILHNREASSDILEIMKSKASLVLKGVFHCFQGSQSLYQWIIDNGFYLGVNGIVTYSQETEKIVKKTPLESLLVETDAPFLIPEPLRKTKKWPNEPKNVKIITERIADIKGDSFLNVSQQITANAVQLFKLKQND